MNVFNKPSATVIQHKSPHRTMLVTVSGEVIVRPQSKDVHVVVLGDVSATLSERGKKAWDSGQELTSDCFDCYLDNRRIYLDLFELS